MSFDLARALRRIQPQRAVNAICHRPFDALPTVTSPVAAGTDVLLDTCVYVDVSQGRVPASVGALLKTRLVNHSTICLAEMTHLFGRLDPAHTGTTGVLHTIQRVIEAVPAHRLSSPSDRAMGEAGMLAGLASRLLGIGHSELPSLLNDASLYLQAVERGWTLLTRNTRDFDYFDQLLPANKVLFYQRPESKC